jgi:tyrosinase
MGVRKNQHDLSDAEKQRYTAAVKQMKAMSGGTFNGVAVNLYDKYVAWHYDVVRYLMTHSNGMTETMNHAHANPAFLPWHRFFVAEFERDLQSADVALGKDGKITVPFWDWTFDNNKDANGQRGSIWKPNFMGPNGDPADNYAVKDGPFKRGDWVLNVLPNAAWDTPPAPWDLSDYLRRNFMGSLPDKSHVDNALELRFYDTPPWDTTPTLSFRNVLEGFRGPGLHNSVHVWVGGAAGGSMLPMTSPNDPVFFLHHCNVDRIWSLWQQKHRNQSYRGVEYPPSRNPARPQQPAGTIHTGGASSTSVTGMGTNFGVDVAVGDKLWITDVDPMVSEAVSIVDMVTVVTITSATSMTTDHAIKASAPGNPFLQGPKEGFGLDDFMYPWDGAKTPLTVKPKDVMNHENMVIGGHDYSYSYAADPAVFIAGAAR